MKFFSVLSVGTAVLPTSFLILSTIQTGHIRTELGNIRSELSEIKSSSTRSVFTRNATLTERALIRGWAVRIFEAPKHRSMGQDVRGAAYAGAFIHTGSWISLDEYKKHEGIFLSGDPALNLRGEFRPRQAGDHIFAVHMKLLPANRTSIDKSPRVSCYARLLDSKGNEILSGKMLVDDARAKGSFGCRLGHKDKNQRAAQSGFFVRL